MKASWGATRPLPLRRPKKLGVAIPGSLLSEVSGLREKTLKAGVVGRACAIFRVDEVIIYRDVERCEDDAALLAELLNYLACPQYLRKLIFPLKSSLRYVGLLPPLRTPNHPLESKISQLPPLSYREGVVVGFRHGSLIVEAGLNKPLIVKGGGRVGDRVIVKLVKDEGKGLTARLSSRDEVPFYFGFTVKLDLRELSKVVRDSGYGFILATSRLGQPLNEVLAILRERLLSSTLVLYGSPKEGLGEILQREGKSLSEVAELTVNFIPNQGVETVRTEEALMASLSIINYLLSH